MLVDHVNASDSGRTSVLYSGEHDITLVIGPGVHAAEPWTVHTGDTLGRIEPISTSEIMIL